jgi:hypothetical protein
MQKVNKPEDKNKFLNSKTRMKNNIKRFLHFQTNYDYKNTILLAAVGRSGTTWVSDIINFKNEYRRLREPFHPYKVPKVRHFLYHQYLRTNNQDKKFIRPVKAILSGRVRNSWVDAENTKLFSNERIVKDIRANLMLYWIHHNFPEIPIVILLRHPCAVANSWIKLGWGKELGGKRTDVEVCLSQPDLIEDHLNPFIKEFDKIDDPFEKHILLWCILYYVPLRQFRSNQIHLAFYEHFCKHPENEIKRLFGFLNKYYDEKIIEQVKKPSAVTRKGSAIMQGSSLIDSWRKDVTEYQIERAINILSIFRLDRIYSNHSMPNIQNAHEIMRD